jgi:GNAT superfamily N-acetyltransferase
MDNSSITFETIRDPDGDLQEFLWERLREASNPRLSDERAKEHHALSILAREKGEIVGGMLAIVYFRGMNLQCLWVREDQRGKKLGSAFLEQAEQAARSLDCTLIHGHTFSFQAPDFYLKAGYEVFGTIEDYPPGKNCFFLRKYLRK